MFSKRFHLFDLFGFPIDLDASWFVVALLLSWSLAVGYFPEAYRGLTTGAYWAMGILGTLGLFASIVLHEIGHAAVARRYDLPIRRIVLFIFGGVAQMEKEPDTPGHEFFVAIGGPCVSVGLGVFFYAVAWGMTAAGTGVAARGIAAYLGLVNLVVVGFNLVPAFPLDGGRVLRSALWAWKRDLRWATRITSAIGSGFGYLMIGLGALAIIAGNFVAGLWWALLGLFLRGAAGMSYQQLRLRRALEGEPLSRFMTREPVVVPPQMSIRDLVDNQLARYPCKLFPVVRDGHLEGCVTLDRIKEIPKDDWGRRTVGEIAQRCGDDNTIDADQDAMAALARMNRADTSRIMVLDGDRLIGMLSLRDLMRFLSLKIELGEGA